MHIMPLIGAQVWLERDHSVDEVDALLRSMAAAHMGVARLFIMWKHVEPLRDQWDFSVYDAAFEAAERYGVKIAATLTVNGPPAHRGEPMLTQGGAVSTTREALLEGDQYIKRVVTRYRQHPALHSWLLMNEPGEGADINSPLAIEEFRNWLRRSYASIDELNRAWMSTWGDFDEVVPPPKPSGWTRYEPHLDWRRFYRHYLAWHMKYLADSVARHDQRTPVHINPHALLYNPAGPNLDLPLLASTVDSLGGSCHASWHFTEEMVQHSQVAVGCICDVLRPAAKPKPFWLTELQGGPVHLSAPRALCPDGATIQRWMWEAVFAGSKAVIFWLWNHRREGSEAGEWGMTTLGGGPTERTRAAEEVARVLAAHGEVFATAEPLPAKVAILSDLDTHTLLLRESGHPGRSADALANAMFRYAQALRGLGVEFDIVSSGSEVEPNLAGYRLIIAPGVYAMSDATAGALRAAVEGGAHLWADGLLGLKTDRGRLSAGLTDVMGARLSELRRLDMATVVRVAGVPVRASGTLGVLEVESAEVVGRWRELPIAITRGHGAGKATWVTLALSEGEQSAAVAALARLLGPHVEGDGLRGGLLRRRMRSGERELVLVTNPTAAPEAVDLAGQVLAASAGSTGQRLLAGGWVVVSS